MCRIMKSFKYKVFRKSTLILINYIHRETKEQALNDLLEDFPDCEIKLSEVTPSHKWGC